MSMLVRIGGKPSLISDFAGKVFKYKDACGIYRTQNGFAQRISKVYPDPGAVLTESSKTLKDGRNIWQKLWSWADGSTVALTRKSDGFFSLVSKDGSTGKVTRSLISNNNMHLVDRGSYSRAINGKLQQVPYENHVNGENIAKFLGGKLEAANRSASSAEYFVQEARKGAEQSFRCIG